MSRLILCLRVSDRPVPHVPSVAVHCGTCQTAVWTDPSIGEPGDRYICNGCFPNYEEVKRSVRACGKTHTPASVVALLRAQAQAFGLVEPDPVAVHGSKFPKGKA